MARIWTAHHASDINETEGGESEDFCLRHFPAALIKARAKALQQPHITEENVDDNIIGNDAWPAMDFGDYHNFKCSTCGKTLTERDDEHPDYDFDDIPAFLAKHGR